MNDSEVTKVVNFYSDAGNLSCIEVPSTDEYQSLDIVPQNLKDTSVSSFMLQYKVQQI